MNRPRKPRYTLIKGQYWIHYPDNPWRGPQPDGDTITFAPDSIELVRGLPRFSGRAPDIGAGGQIADVEKQVFDVASYRRQLDLITEALLSIASEETIDAERRPNRLRG